MSRRTEQARAKEASKAEPESDLGDFPLAPMAPVYVLTTGVILAIPTCWLILIFVRPELRTTSIWMSACFTAIAALTWTLLRPTRFVVDERSLRLVWPLRSLEVARSSIRHARVVRREDLDLVFGRAWRLAVGGLFGNFGVLRTAKRGWISAYLTSTDAWVLIERDAGRPLLLSPADPARFIRAIT